ncbi:glycoside hydrolase family 2 TIM barrel-domain containing protein [Arcicella sp. DC2W]|uniref:beta-galactosidase n=1 Tax=Arcicella gelida TaxID=2984195 RepID=A0ABU5S8D7_9BACT|nr:sugar-binding domain-containing protein [Arcicella sp. DC2W]MEA5404742.1 glycoside hydrolase family 2 TIM barrel-domain containing protein [Arcicella sp. DC2W]
MIKNYLFILCLLFGNTINAQKISLAGNWQFKIDSADVGVKDKWFNSKLSETIKLPGSMLENGKGNPVTIHTQWTGSIYDSSWYFNPHLAKYRTPENLKFPFWLTPAKYYVGAAWYQKAIDVPKSWANKRIVLTLERPHTETRVWIDNEEIGLENSMCVAQTFDLTDKLSTGKHTISIRVDNRIKAINVGKDSHSLTDHTQGNWNGIVGKIELEAESKIWFDDIQVYPDLVNHLAKVKIVLKNSLQKPVEGQIKLSAKSFNSIKAHSPKLILSDFQIDGQEKSITIDYPMGDDFQTWDEFSPALYHLSAEIIVKKQVQSARKVQFGMRGFAIKGTRFEINGRPIFLRGTVENCQFPLTGYAPMDVASWEKVFRKAKAYGLNHFRFHSYCPPEAAFIAADLVGIYLQPEGPSWANHGSSLGDGHPIDQFIMDETNRMAKAYGNYASFCMLAYGNEPRGSKQVDYLTKFINYWKTKDPRRKYTGASVAMSWPLVPSNEYMIKSGPRGLPWNKLPSSTEDFADKVKDFKVPYLTHELGQWCVFPNFKEISKYTGVYKAKNYELFQEDLKDKDMEELGEKFFMATGKLQALSYKTEIETAFRTPISAGIQMLGLNDYSGQGTALVGILDSFWEEKGYISQAEFAQFCNTTVPLARIPKFVYKNSESFEANIEMFHFGKDVLNNAQTSWQIFDENKQVLAKGKFDKTNIPIGNNFNIGKVSFALNAIQKAQKLVFEVRIDDTAFMNNWEFWVYPEALPIINTNEIYFCKELDAKAEEILQNGGKVFLEAAGKIEKGKEVVNYFQPVFWNTSWFKMRPPHTLGFLCEPSHPAFQNFPTEYHSNLQWWEITNRSQVMLLDSFPAGFRPIVQPIDTWFLNRKLGLILEAKVGKGKLIISSADLSTEPDKRFVARQLLYSLKTYMNSPQFNPASSVDIKEIKALFDKNYKSTFKTYTKDAPDELKVKKPTAN